MTTPLTIQNPQAKQERARFRTEQLERRPMPEAGSYPIVFRAAIRDITDPEANRVHYVADDEGNNVYWDEWDPSFDTSVYSIDQYDQTNDPDEGLVIAGVALLKRGLYSIRAICDVDAAISGMVSVSSNWDEGQKGAHYVNNIGAGGQPYWGDFYGFQVNDWRFVEIDNPDTTPPIGYFPDNWFGGEAETVEIVLDVHTGVDGFGVTGGKNGGSPGDDVWVPGGYDGAWGFVPNLLVAYWGDPGVDRGADPDWPATFGLAN